jgi:hypothetical protein
MKKILILIICFYAITSKAQTITLAKNTKLVYDCVEDSSNADMAITILEYGETASFNYNINFFQLYKGNIKITKNNLQNATDVLFSQNGIYTYKKENSKNYTGLWVSKKIYAAITKTKKYIDKYYDDKNKLIKVVYEATPVKFTCIVKGENTTLDAILLKSEIVYTPYTTSYSYFIILKDEKNPLILERKGILMYPNDEIKEIAAHSMVLKTIN